MRFASIVVVSITLSSTAHAGNGFIVIPPIEFDMGVGAPVGEGVERLSPSTEIMVGLHWASLAWKPTRFDVGAGYVGSFRLVDRSGIGDDELRMHGGYLQLATTIAKGDNWRTWFAARGELLRVYDHEFGSFGTVGSAVRVSTELFGQTHSTGRNAVAVGTFALGIYVEATYRHVPRELGPLGLTTGLSCRIPFLGAG